MSTIASHSWHQTLAQRARAAWPAAALRCSGVFESLLAAPALRPIAESAAGVHFRHLQAALALPPMTPILVFSSWLRVAWVASPPGEQFVRFMPATA